MWSHRWCGSIDCVECHRAQFVALVVTLVVLFAYFYGQKIRRLAISIKVSGKADGVKERVSDEARLSPAP